MSATDVLKLINQRYTVKAFKPNLVPEEDVEKILAAGMDAPSKQNKYPYHMYVLNNRSDAAREKRKALEKYTSCKIDLAGYETTFFQNEIKTSPLSVLLTIKPVMEDWECGELHERASTLRSTRDAMMPTVFMLLQAQELGLGTSCTGCFENGIKEMDEFRKEFGMDDDEHPCVVLNIGYPEEVTDEKPDRKIPRRVAADGTVSYAEELEYVDESDPSKGVFAAFNRGTTRKKQPQDFLKLI